MDYKRRRVAKGVRVITVPLANLESATVTVWVGTGSRNEEKRVSGISHFLEHMAFKGSKKRPSAREIAEAVDAIGGEFNAATSKEWTRYYIRVRAKLLPIAFDVLSDILLNPLLKNEDIEREKGVIVEEIGMYEDTPVQHIWDVFEGTIFGNSALGRDVIGTRKTVKSLTKADFERYRKTHYYAKNLLVTVAGGVKEEEVLKLTEKFFGKVKNKKKREIKKFKASQTKPLVRLDSEKREQAHFILGFLGKPLGHKDRYSEAVLNAILGRGMSSRLFSEVREKRGLAYSVKSEVDSLSDTGYFAAYAGVDPKKVDEAIKVVLEQFYSIANGTAPILEQELAKAKEYIKGHFALSLEDTRHITNFFGYEEIIRGKVRGVEEVFEGINKVEVKDVLKVAKDLFVPKKLNLAIIGPYKSKSKFEKLLR